MYIFFMVVVLTVGGEPEFQTYGTAPGFPKHFFTKEACEQIAFQKTIEFTLLYPKGLIVESGCAKLKNKWDT